METRQIIAYVLIALLALAAAGLINHWRLRVRAQRRAMRGHPVD
jgi:hypothetical protein